MMYRKSFTAEKLRIFYEFTFVVPLLCVLSVAAVPPTLVRKFIDVEICVLELKWENFKRRSNIPLISYDIRELITIGWTWYFYLNVFHWSCLKISDIFFIICYCSLKRKTTTNKFCFENVRLFDNINTSICHHIKYYIH